MAEGYENHIEYMESRSYYRDRPSRNYRNKLPKSTSSVWIRVTLANGAIEEWSGVGREYAQILESKKNFNLNFWANHPNGGRIFRQLNRNQVSSITIID